MLSGTKGQENSRSAERSEIGEEERKDEHHTLRKKIKISSGSIPTKIRLERRLTRSSESNDDVLGVVEDDFVEVGSGELEGSGGRRSLDLALDSSLLGDAASQT